MKTIIVNESQLSKLVKKIQKDKLNEGNMSEIENYMFFSNLSQMHRQAEKLLELNHDEVDGILNDGHDWAADHISEAKNNMDQVFDFLMNELKRKDMVQESDEDNFTVEPWVSKMPREFELSTIFGKYWDQVPDDVLRYMRKNPQSIIETLYVLYGDSLIERVYKAVAKINQKRGSKSVKGK
jgi:hypothetical protein